MNCNICRKPGVAELALTTSVSVRVGGTARTKAGDVKTRHARIGYITLCADCYGSVVTTRPGFEEVAGVEVWRGQTLRQLRAEGHSKGTLPS